TSGALPGGLGLTAGCVISGTPPGAGSFSFSGTPTDSNTVSGSARPLSIVISGGCSILPTTPGPSASPEVVSVTFTATSCATSTWSATGLTGSGLSINSSTGVLSGTAATPATYNAVISYSTGSQPVSIVINPAPTVSTTSLPSGN